MNKVWKENLGGKREIFPYLFVTSKKAAVTRSDSVHGGKRGIGGKAPAGKKLRIARWPYTISHKECISGRRGRRGKDAKKKGFMGEKSLEKTQGGREQDHVLLGRVRNFPFLYQYDITERKSSKRGD